MRVLATVSLILFVFSIAITSFSSATGLDQGSPAQEQMVVKRLNRMSLSFTENQGQFGGEICFRANARGASFFFSPNQVIYQFTRRLPGGQDSFDLGKWRVEGSKSPSHWGDDFRTGGEVEHLYVRVKFVGANPHPQLFGEGLTQHKCNYFIGNDPSKWRSNVPNYSAVTYKDLYPGIDLKYYGDGRTMKYDFIVHPGADPSVIAIEYSGVNGVSLDDQGQLIVSTRFGDIIERMPYVYQEIGHDRREIPSRYVRLRGESFGFSLGGDYDLSRLLYIDPVLELSYSTFLGGIGQDRAHGIAVTASGRAYVTGYTESTDFPTANPSDGSLGGTCDVFVTGFSTSGDSLIYSTYLGGDSIDIAYSIAIDGDGCVYVTGYTCSANFPTVNPYDGSYNGSEGDLGDIFVTKLSSTGDSLIYSTFLGGNRSDQGLAIAVDSTACAYVTGRTWSHDFPTTPNAYDTSAQVGSAHDIFITKFAGSGDSLIYSTYLKGQLHDVAYGIAVDASGCAYVTGLTLSSNFPTINPFQDTLKGERDAIVTKLSSSGDSLIYSTYLGGGIPFYDCDFDWGNSIAVDREGSAYVTGETRCRDFPVDDPMTMGGGYSDAFITKFSPSGNSLIYSRGLGGIYRDWGTGIAVDKWGCTYVTGTTDSPNFPLVNAYDEEEHSDIFLTKYSATGDTIIYSTFLGGDGVGIADYQDEGWGVAVDGSGCAHVAGWTEASDFPTFNAYQSDYAGGEDAIVAKFGNLPPFAFIDTLYPKPAQIGEEVVFLGHGLDLDTDGSIIAYNWRSDVDGQLSDEAYFITSDLSAAIHIVYFKVQDDDSAWSEEVSDTLEILENEPPTASIDAIYPNPADQWTEVFFIGHGEDSDGSVVGFEWTSSIDGQLSDQTSFSSTDLSVGTHIIYFRVLDDDDSWSEDAQDTIIVTLTGNSRPTAFIDTIYPNPAVMGEEIFFIGDGDDADGFIVAYKWTSDVEGYLSSGASFSTSDLTPTTHVVSFKVQDNDDAWSEEVSRTLQVECGDLGFRPDPDGWQFADSAYNMWPASWYQQFDYTQYPYTCDPFFVDRDLPLPDSVFPDWPLFVSVFGEDQCYFDPPPGDVIFRWQAIWFWFTTSGFKWRGSSFGFAISSFLFFDDFLDVATEFPGHTEVHSVPINDDSRLMQNRYWLYRHGEVQQQYENSTWYLMTPNETFLECAEMFNDPIRDDRVLVMRQLNRTVTPYTCGGDPEDPDVRYIYVYDSEFPSVDTMRVLINTSSNTWSYLGEGGYDGLFLMDPVSDYTVDPVMSGASKDGSKSDYVRFYMSPAEAALFECASGNIGHTGDSLFSTVSSGHPIMSLSGQKSPPMGYYLPDDDWTCQFSGVGESSFRLGLFTSNTVLVYHRQNVDYTQTEQLRYPGNDSTLLVRNPDPASRSYQLEAVCIEPDSEVCYSITGISIDPGDSTCHSLEGESQLRIDNYGDARLYDLRVRIANSAVDTSFVHRSISLPGFSSHLIVPDWRQHGDSLLILEDSGMTGTFGDTISVDNQGEYIRGDANMDGMVNIGDAIYLLNYLFKGGDPPVPTAAGDSNCDGAIDLGDVIYLLNYLFKGGYPPSC